jgi:uracil-DNA glycosylase
MENERSELLAIVQGIRSRDIANWSKGKTKLPEPRAQQADAPTSERFAVDPALSACQDLPSLHNTIKDCVKCALGKTRKNFVFGEGNPKAKLMFIGEAPGADEDRLGRPFVGRAGQLLTKIIEAMGLAREDVYIANLLKCRPPNNRPPAPDEIEKCWPHVTAQIRLIGPKVICTLGSPATKAVLAADLPIGALRGKFHEIDGIPVMPTYHPAYLLRSPGEKSKVWEDMKKVRDFLKEN